MKKSASLFQPGLQAGESAAPAKEYLCFFCATGQEWNAAHQIEQAYPGVRAFPVQQVKRKTHKGKTELVKQIIFPGYVFAQAEGGFRFSGFSRIRGVLKLLHEETDGLLHGRDREFAEWIFGLEGVIGFSKAYKENDRIRILSGPLKDLEGRILKVDKRNGSAQVALEFGRQVIKSWLAYDLVTDARENAGLKG